MNKRNSDVSSKLTLKRNLSSKVTVKNDQATTCPKQAKKKRKQQKRKFGNDITNQQMIPEPQQVLEQPQLSKIIQYTQLQPYLSDINSHLVQMDQKYFQEAKYYFQKDSQQSIKPQMRMTLIKWIVQVGQYFHVRPQTIHICIQLIDYVVVIRTSQISKSNYQLLGIAAFFVASKYNEIYVADAERYVYFCGGSYNINELFQMQALILLTTDFNLQIPTVINFSNQLTRLADLPDACLQLVKNLSNLCVFDHILFNQYKKIHLAISIVYFSAKIVGCQNIKSKDIIQFLGINEETFKACLMQIMQLYKSGHKLAKN